MSLSIFLSVSLTFSLSSLSLFLFPFCSCSLPLTLSIVSVSFFSFSDFPFFYMSLSFYLFVLFRSFYMSLSLTFDLISVLLTSFVSICFSHRASLSFSLPFCIFIELPIFKNFVLLYPSYFLCIIISIFNSPPYFCFLIHISNFPILLHSFPHSTSHPKENLNQTNSTFDEISISHILKVHERNITIHRMCITNILHYFIIYLIIN